MAIYAIGDIQGCFDDLLRLLDKINFDKSNDQIWFTGDLVNRGPKSLETLRFVKDLGSAAVTVLGSDDLHLLAASCNKRGTHKKDSLDEILAPPDRDELLYWLRHQPLLHYNKEFCLIHAGLPPQWCFKHSKKMAAKVERVLQSDDYKKFLEQMYGNKPDIWSDELKGVELLRFIVNCFTRMRFCETNGKLNFEHNGALGSQPKHLTPWFSLPNRKNKSMRIIFGHWSTLGFYQGNNCYAIDTGCLWGGQLTALRLGSKIKRFSVDCAIHKKPG